MEKIKEITSLLLQGTITKDEADKILLDLFVIINSWDRKTCKRCGRDLKIECPSCLGAVSGKGYTDKCEVSERKELRDEKTKDYDVRKQNNNRL